MSKFKGTPGPWTALPAEADKPYIRVRGTRLGRLYKIANVLGFDSEFDAEETAANANLIAAAPTYYEAGVEFRAYEAALAAGDDVAAMWHYARASELIAEAHAKATGEQP